MFRALALTVAAFGLALTGLAGAGSPLWAQGNCPNCDLPPGCRGNGNQNGNGNGNQGRNCQRLEITIESNVDFGRLVLLGNGAGQVVLDLTTGQKFPAGDIDDLGGMPVTGRATITGAPLEQIVINLPGEIAMRDPVGGNARIRDFVTDLEGFPMLDANGQIQFRFSGTLVIDGETRASGNLRGRIPISVEYP